MYHTFLLFAMNSIERMLVQRLRLQYLVYRVLNFAQERSQEYKRTLAVGNEDRTYFNWSVTASIDRIFRTNAHCVSVYDREGTFIKKWDNWIKTANASIVADKGELFISNVQHLCIQVFTEDGVFLRQWNHDPISSDCYFFTIHNDLFYTFIPRRLEVEICQKDGKVLRRLQLNNKGENTGDNNLRFCGIAVSNKRIFVFRTFKVHVLNHEGQFIRECETKVTYDDVACGNNCIACWGNFLLILTNSRIYIHHIETGEHLHEIQLGFMDARGMHVTTEGIIYVTDYCDDNLHEYALALNTHANPPLLIRIFPRDIARIICSFCHCFNEKCI